MAEITLADYTGYIFLEIIRAREMADAYSRSVAARYAQDEVLKSFSTPRFKIPAMQLTIPVLISGARFSQVVKYTVPREDFRKLIGARVANLVRTVQFGDGGIVRPLPRAAVASKRPAKADRARTVVTAMSPFAAARAGFVPSDALLGLFDDFHAELQASPDATQPAGIVRAQWAHIVEVALAESGLTASYERQFPGNELFERSVAELTTTVLAGTQIMSTQISNLLVNPETNVVKNGSDATSVFTIRADLTEEGFFVKTATDARTGVETKIVEFE